MCRMFYMKKGAKVPEGIFAPNSFRSPLYEDIFCEKETNTWMNFTSEE